MGDLAEAAVLSQQRDAIRPLITDLEAAATRSRSPVLLAGLSYARPLLAPDREAEPLFLAALGDHLTGWPLLRARTQLAYGQWLRRQRRIEISARSELRGALRASAVDTLLASVP